ncbi:MAG TPA: hypothetical protein VIF15_04890 [Polyangiaceae bacterium]|jgi:hypothetical protein
MKDDGKLPRELVWDGVHVSELALSALADGQEAILDVRAVEHVDACEWCAGRLGRAALVSATVGEALGEVAIKPATASSPARAAARPLRALALGLAVAVLAALPTVPQLGSFVRFALAFAARGVPVLARGGVALASSEAVRGALPTATLAASALLVVMGWAIARSRSRTSSEGSMS